MDRLTYLLCGESACTLFDRSLIWARDNWTLVLLIVIILLALVRIRQRYR